MCILNRIKPKGFSGNSELTQIRCLYLQYICIYIYVVYITPPQQNIIWQNALKVTAYAAERSLFVDLSICGPRWNLSCLDTHTVVSNRSISSSLIYTSATAHVALARINRMHLVVPRNWNKNNSLTSQNVFSSNAETRDIFGCSIYRLSK